MTTFLYDKFDSPIFILALIIEVYQFLIHIGSFVDKIPHGTKYREYFIRMSLFFETYSIHTCFWHFNYSWKILMTSHYIFHLISNFINCFLLLPDFSIPFTPNSVYWAVKAVLIWDITCHSFIFYNILLVLNIYQIIIGFSIALLLIFNYPQRLVFAK
jgi:hypothetical protein